MIGTILSPALLFSFSLGALGASPAPSLSPQDDAPARVSRAQRLAVQDFLEAAPGRDEKKALKAALKALKGDLAVAAQALRSHSPLTEAKRGTRHGLEFESGGHTWEYSIRLPSDYDGNRRFPVLVLPDHMLIDGPSGIGFWEGQTGAEELILFRPRILALREDEERFPERQFFDRDQDVAEVMADALVHLRLHYAVDHDRFFMTGLSQAGYYTWYYAVSFPDQFAGIVPESAGGLSQRAAVHLLARNLLGMDVLILHSRADAICPWKDSDFMRGKLAELGARVELVTYTDADYIGEPYTQHHPGPHHLRLRHVLSFIEGRRRSVPASFTRVVRYAQQGREGRFLLPAPRSHREPRTITCSAQDGALATDAKDVVYLVSPQEVLADIKFKVKGRRVRVKVDIENMLLDFKLHGDPARLCAAEIPVRKG
jgi:predicted esterase